MEHFYSNIDGWFSYDYIYKHVVDTARDGELFVEIGSFKGRSSAYMAVEIINSGKNIRFDCIDTWEGSPEHQKGAEAEVKEVVNGTLYKTFLQNMKPVHGYYRPIKMTSLQAAEIYDDRSIDFLMIDGAHEYESVVADIRAYLPKIKIGGVIAGDDVWGDERMPETVSGPAWASIQELHTYDFKFVGNHFYCVINK
jgi:predicted O-methyltransferase YrrM